MSIVLFAIFARRTVGKNAPPPSYFLGGTFFFFFFFAPVPTNFHTARLPLSQSSLSQFSDLVSRFLC